MKFPTRNGGSVPEASRRARRGADRGCPGRPRGLLDPAGLCGAGALPGSAPLARFEAGFGEGGRKRA